MTTMGLSWIFGVHQVILIFFGFNTQYWSYLYIESEINICRLTMMEISGLEVPLQGGGEEGDFCN